MVTSGAIALGWRLMELPQRPRTVDELQAASAIGQGSLFRAYESRLAARDVHAAQVLLTSYDLSVRMHYLNARQALRRMLEWRAVPVVNENDTTATDEITFGDNDFLSAQLALLLDARLLVLLTDTAGLHTADPRRDPAASRVATRRRLRELEAYEIGDRRSLYGSGGMRSKVSAAGMASAAGIPAVICDGTEDGSLLAAARGDDVGHGVRPASRAHARPSSSGSAMRSPLAAGSRSTPARRGCCARAARACCRSGSSGSRASSRPATPSTWSSDGGLVGKGIANYSAAELARIKGMKSAQVLELLPNASEEAVHRDRFVLA